MNGLRGRLLRLPAPKSNKREMLVVYGHHSSLERWYSLAQVMNDFGGVTMPDLPGFGGMDTFYKIKEMPDLDTMADYLASVVKLRFKNRRITIIGLSYGFLVVTRMLQRYPDIVKRTDVVISLVGFAHHEDLVFSRTRHALYLGAASFFALRLPAAFFHNVILHPSVLRAFYSRTHNAKHKFVGLSDAERVALTEFEVHLWRINEIRTYMKTAVCMLTVNNCEASIDKPVWHIGVEVDNYFDNKLVEQHMRIIFNDFYLAKSSSNRHTPNVLAGKTDMAKLIPKEIRRLLRKKV